MDETSRLSRQKPLEYIAKVLYPLSDASVLIDTVSEGVLDPDNLADMILATVRQDRAAQESPTTARRVLTGYAKLAKTADIQTGKPPFAYRRIRENGHPRLVLGPENEVAAVRFIFDAYANRDLSLANICRLLEARGTLTPKGNAIWKPTTVRKIIKDEVYLGTYLFNRRHYGRFYQLTADGVKTSPNKKTKKNLDNPREAWTVTPNQHEAIIDPDTFRKAQEALLSNRRRTTPLGSRDEFLLSKFLVCAECGGWMCGLRGGRRRKPGYVGYRCSRSGTAGKCRLNLVREQEVLPAIIEVLRKRFLNPAFLGKLRAAARKMDEKTSSTTHADQLRSELDELTRRVTRARKNLSLLEDDMLTEVVADIRKWEARREEVQQEMATCGSPSNATDMEEVIAEVESLLRSLEEAVADFDPEKVRNYLRSRIAWVEVKVEPVQIGKNKYSYTLVGGRVVLKGGSLLNAVVSADGPRLPSQREGEGASFNLFTTPVSGEQVSAWSCVMPMPS